MYYAQYHPYHRGIQHQDQRFAPFGLLPFITGGVLGLAVSPFLFGRRFYPPYPPYPPFGYGYGGYPFY
jgi:hypothetical protein